MKKIRNFFITATICFIIGIGGAFYYNFETKRKEELYLNSSIMSLNMPDIERVKQRVISKTKIQNVVLQSIAEKKELITMVADLTQDIFWDESFTNFEVFKKIQKMTFFGTGKYCIDLSDFNNENIFFDEYNNNLIVKINKPIINIEVDPTKTLIFNTNNGFLRFGDIKYTSAEINQIEIIVREKMLEELNTKNMLKESEEKSKNAITELFISFLKGINVDDVSIEVSFI